MRLTRRRMMTRAGLAFGLANLTPLGSEAFAETYEYDALGRITRVNYPNGMSAFYFYDGAGNRRQVVTQSSALPAPPPPGDPPSPPASECTWTQRTSAGNLRWTALALSANGAKIAAVNNGPSSDYLLTSTDAGATWTARPAAGGPFTKVLSSSNGNTLAAMTISATLRMSTNSGGNWANSGSLTPLVSTSAIAGSSDLSKIAVQGYRGVQTGPNPMTDMAFEVMLARSSNAGTSFATSLMGTYNMPTVPFALNLASSSDGTKLVAPITITVNGSTYAPAYLYRSINSGANWTSVLTNGGQRFWVALASSADGARLYGATLDSISPMQPGNIYRSTDSGANWSQLTSAGQRLWGGIATSSDGMRIIASDSNNGYLHFSIDGGASWTQQTSAGQRTWAAVAMSADGSTIAATHANAGTAGYIYTGTYPL